MARAWYHYVLIGLLALACRSRDDVSMNDTNIAVADSAVQNEPAEARRPRDTPLEGRLYPKSVVDTATLPTVQALIALHPQMVDSLVTAMSDEMRRMYMTSSPEWTALRDSVMKDLDRFAIVGNTELVPLFREHHARLVRLVRLHQSVVSRPPNADSGKVLAGQKARG
jgi:hypothetical protein